jgi:hypothetical protein
MVYLDYHILPWWKIEARYEAHDLQVATEYSVLSKVRGASPRGVLSSCPGGVEAPMGGGSFSLRRYAPCSTNHHRQCHGPLQHSYLTIPSSSFSSSSSPSSHGLHIRGSHAFQLRCCWADMSSLVVATLEKTKDLVIIKSS